MDAALWLLPAVGALIGWLTNEIAVRMLFRPKHPLKIPFTGLVFQGVLPKRHADLAASIGRTVADDLLPTAELLSHLDVQGFKSDLVRAVGDHVDDRIRGSVTRLLPTNVQTAISTYVREVVEREAETVMEDLLDHIGDEVVERIDVRSIVEQKMLELNLDELEQMARRIAGKELHAIVVFGAVLGFFIGLLQMLIVSLLLPTASAIGS